MSLGILTPPWITHRVLDKGFVPEPGAVVWDPLCGEGHIAEVLRKRGFQVLATNDKQPRWDGCDGVQDFSTVEECDPAVKLICTRVVPGDEYRAIICQALDLMDVTDGAVLILGPAYMDDNPEVTDLLNCSPFAAKLVCVGAELAWYYWNWRYTASPSIHYLVKKP